MKKPLTLIATLLLAAGAHAACYTVMGPKGQILSQSSTPPVDMSYQLHQTVPYRYGQGATMVFGIADANCGPDAGQTVPHLHFHILGGVRLPDKMG